VRIDAAIAALPAAFDDNLITQAQAEVDAATRALHAAEQVHLNAVRDLDTLTAANSQAELLTQRRSHLSARTAQVEASLSTWTLFARCMSNDGLIALAIDDAGPALAALTNDLLLACYGPRFSVAIRTLVDTAKGLQKEGFEIVVNDGDSGESKNVALMSGGEKIWINEALTRAVALYLAQNAGRRYETLFSDEADGALDEEHKRMFIAMKRQVLRLGGYRREFFVSQTPELTALADAVIDMDSMVGAVA
jgi:exonuclease SbcC